MKIKWKHVPLLVFILLVAHTQAQSSMNLNQAIDYALAHSIEMRKHELQVEDAHEQIREYTAIGIPKVDLGVNYQYYFAIPSQPTEDFITPAIYGVLFQENVLDPRELGPPETFQFAFARKNNLTGAINVKSLLFDASYLVGLKAARLYKELVKKQDVIIIKNIKENVTKAYMAVLVAEKNRTILESNLENTSTLLSETKEFYKEGFVEKLDVDRLQLSVDQLDNQLTTTTQLIELSYNLLKFQMNFPLDEELKATESLEDMINLINIEELGLTDMVDYSQRPEYDILNATIELDEVDLSRLEKSWLPSLTFQANAQQALQRDKLFDGNEAGWIGSSFVGLGLNYKLFDGFERSAQTQRVKIRLDQSKLQKAEFERGMDLQVANTTINFTNAKNKLDHLTKSLELSEEIYRKSQIKFEEGVGSSTELHQDQASLFLAQSNYISALYDLIVAKVDRDLALGILK